jgi:hypothetical protein
LRDPEGQPWQRQAARTLDRAVNFVAGAEPLEPFAEPAQDVRAAWPEAVAWRAELRPGGPCPPGAGPDAGDLAAVPVVPIAGITGTRPVLLATDQRP